MLGFSMIISADESQIGHESSNYSELLALKAGEGCSGHSSKKLRSKLRSSKILSMVKHSSWPYLPLNAYSTSEY
jgi:hypothetical protein